MEKGNQLNLDCIDFGTIVEVHGHLFWDKTKDNPYQFLGAVVEGRPDGSLDCIDFGTIVEVHGHLFWDKTKDNPYQFLGAVVEGRPDGSKGLQCRFLSTTSSNLFVATPAKVQNWIVKGWITEFDPNDDREDAIHLSLLE